VVRDARRIEKPWGFELVWAETEFYVGKLLHVRGGEALSIQYHERKDETLHLLEGEVRLRMGPDLHDMSDVEFRPGQSVRIRPGTIHQMEAVTDCRLLEASTPQLDDVVRLLDRYGRAPGASPAEGPGPDR
jgi:mannose-6-phosphate isomerase